MVDVLDGVIGDAEYLLTAGMTAMAIWFVMWTWVRTRSLMPVLGAVVLGAVVLWGVNNIGTIEQRVGEDVTDYSNGRTARGGG
jgi:hypothetical protein